MPVEVGTNSYVTVDEASTYLGDRLYAEAWDTAIAGDQAKALVMAARSIDRLVLAGTKLDSTQDMQFPRTIDGIDQEVVPTPVKEAQIEEALYLLGATRYERKRLRDNNMGRIGGSIGDANEYSSTTVVRRVTGRAVHSPDARELLKPYLLRTASIG